MADVLEEMAALEDPRTGRSLLDRTVLIANTSNMPVLAREASIYTGGHGRGVLPRHGLRRGPDRRLHVTLGRGAARSCVTHRRAAGRGGYPAGLASALAAFYERAGRVRTPSDADASVTILGAVSPPGGDMTEPVSAHTRRFVRCTLVARPGSRVRAPLSGSELARLVLARCGADRRMARRERRTGLGTRREHALRLLAEADHLESIAAAGWRDLASRPRARPAPERTAAAGGSAPAEQPERQRRLLRAREAAGLARARARRPRACLELVDAGIPIGRDRRGRPLARRFARATHTTAGSAARSKRSAGN